MEKIKSTCTTVLLYIIGVIQKQNKGQKAVSVKQVSAVSINVSFRFAGANGFGQYSESTPF